jgi:hypothetical protein
MLNYKDFLLLEKNRIEYLKIKHKDIDPDIFNILVRIDPSNNKKYLQWIINLYNKGNLLEEDFYKASDYLSMFEEIKHLIEKKDINYYKSLSELISTIKKVGGTGKPSQDEEDLINDRYYINNDEAKLIHEDDDYLIVSPLTLSASEFYGNNTEWCTTKSNQFKNYTDKGILYIIINKSLLNSDDPLRRLQFFFEDSMFMDINDTSIPDNLKFSFYKYFNGKVSPLKLAHLKYPVVSAMSDGKFVGVCNKYDGECGFIDETGEIVIPLEYDDINDFKTGLAPAKKNNKWGIIDTNNKLVVPFKYDYINLRKYGNSIVYLNGKCGLLTPSFKELTPIKYDKISLSEFGNKYISSFKNWSITDNDFNDKTANMLTKYIGTIGNDHVLIDGITGQEQDNLDYTQKYDIKWD